jgi:hypothetical protein
MLKDEQAALASRIFRTLLYTGRIQAQWAEDDGERVPRVENREIRRTNLIALIRSCAMTKAAFARRVETNPAYISQMLSGKRGLGTALARRIEASFGLERGWMDHLHADDNDQKAAGGRRATQPVPEWDSLGDDTKSQLRALIVRLSALEQDAKKKPKKGGS